MSLNLFLSFLHTTGGRRPSRRFLLHDPTYVLFWFPLLNCYRIICTTSAWQRDGVSRPLLSQKLKPLRQRYVSLTVIFLESTSLRGRISTKRDANELTWRVFAWRLDYLRARASWPCTCLTWPSGTIVFPWVDSVFAVLQREIGYRPGWTPRAVRISESAHRRRECASQKRSTLLQ